LGLSSRLSKRGGYLVLLDRLLRLSGGFLLLSLLLSRLGGGSSSGLRLLGNRLLLL